MKTEPRFEITHAEKFPLELGRAPKKVRNAYQSVVLPTLQSAPDQPDPPRIKRLTRYKNLWRLRISDEYRLVYRVDKTPAVVTMLMLDHRAKIYERLGSDEDGKPGIRIIIGAEGILEPEPGPEEIGGAVINQGISSTEPDVPSSNRPLPVMLDTPTLEAWGVSPEYHSYFKDVRTEGELLELVKSIPANIIERVMNGLWPPLIEDVVQQPTRTTADPSAIESAAVGELSLESFLLKLDGEQRDFVARFDGRLPKGPWLLKGGPGSGKSTIALYCIRALIRGADMHLFNSKPLRILFTTFTKALINGSGHLLKELKVQDGRHEVHVKNVDSLAFSYLPKTWKNMKVGNDTGKHMIAALERCKALDRRFEFSTTDAKFLMEEVDWVLIGQDLRSFEEYLKADRTGRGRRLGQQQRRQIWQLSEEYKRQMHEANVCLFSEWLQHAAERVAPDYDYVFIDEAQDLKPVAIRFCIGLCRNRENVFLTADTNQSIYGAGLSWSKVASDLQFKGRARVLKRNYRATSEIWQALAQLAPDTPDTDRETLDVEPVFHGPYPILARYNNTSDLAERLNTFLHEGLRQERLTPSCAAVLCPTDAEMKKVMKWVDPQFNAKAMHSKDADLGHPGVKVLSMHAAKGLQFPVVAIVGLEEGILPRPVPEGIDHEEHYTKQRRVLFVACSRAMRRLIVFSSAKRPSRFMQGISDDRWEIENL